MQDKGKEFIQSLPYQDMKDTVLLQKYQCWTCRSRNIYISITAPDINVYKYPVCGEYCAKGFEHTMKEKGFKVYWNELPAEAMNDLDHSILMKKVPCICGKKVFIGLPAPSKDLQFTLLCCGQCAEKFKSSVRKQGKVVGEA